MCLFVLVSHVLAQVWRHFGRHFTIDSPIDFSAYLFVSVFVALPDFHIGVKYNSGFFSLWSDSTVATIYAGHHCKFESFTGWVFFHGVIRMVTHASFWWPVQRLHLLETSLPEVANNLVFDDCHF